MSRQGDRARFGSDRTSLYDDITNQIIAQLEAGTFPWVEPWRMSAAKAPLALPKNASTGRRYSGINILVLWGAVIEHGLPSQGWLTFGQAVGLGGHVRKGERGTTVFYADRFVPEDQRQRAHETGAEAQAIPFLKRFTVFNVGTMRGPARRHHRCRPACARQPHRPSGRHHHQELRHRFPHRRRSRLLYAGGRLRTGPAAPGVFRAGEFSPQRAT
jgi:antirestriction protein ArdC